MGHSPQSESNPYAPPLEVTTANWPLLPPERWHEVQVRVERIVREEMNRKIWVTGTTDAEIHYVPGAMDTVYVNGQARGWASLWDTTPLSPTIEFWLDGHDHRIPARIDVVGAWSWTTVIRLAHLKLTVAGRVIYSE